MDFPSPGRLFLPVSPYGIGGYSFGQRIRRRFLLSATHLGEDIKADGGTAVAAIGDGVVVCAETRPGAPDHKNWGGLVIIGHQRRRTRRNFYSVYGHLRNLAVRQGERVNSGQLIGVVAEELTAANGWWKIPHLHFAIYSGPWRGQIMPGFKRTENMRMRLSWWHAPGKFIEDYNRD